MNSQKLRRLAITGDHKSSLWAYFEIIMLLNIQPCAFASYIVFGPNYLTWNWPELYLQMGKAEWIICC